MQKSRLEAFSDGVLAIVITIMVLELHPPHEGTLEALRPLLPSLLSYVLSFLYVGIYWSNHHHMLHASHGVNGKIIWANLHLLFWLSLFPAVTGWLGHDPSAAWPVTLYGVVLFAAGVAYRILQHQILQHAGRDSLLAEAVGSDIKGTLSVVIYLIGIALAFYVPWLSNGLYAAVALMWIVPDARIERAFARK